MDLGGLALDHQVDALPCAACALTEEGTVLALNTDLETLLGLPAEQALGRPLATLLDRIGTSSPLPHPLQATPDGFLLTFGSQPSKRVFQCKLHQGHASSNTLFFLFTAVEAPPGSPAPLNEDTTSQKLHLLGRLAAGIAHDFNNSLAAIQYTIQLIADEMEETSRDETLMRDSLQEVISATVYASELTQQLLNYAKDQPQGPSAVHVGAAVENMSRMLGRILPGHTRIELDLPDTLHPVFAIPNQFDQILANMIMNASDAMPEGGLLRISAENTTHTSSLAPLGSDAGSFPCVCLRFIDEGTGIAPDVIDSIFEPFYTTKSSRGGAGLGLPTVRRILEDIHGQIEVESLLDQGTTFTLFLPAQSTS